MTLRAKRRFSMLRLTKGVQQTHFGEFAAVGYSWVAYSVGLT